MSRRLSCPFLDGETGLDSGRRTATVRGGRSIRRVRSRQGQGRFSTSRSNAAESSSVKALAADGLFPVHHSSAASACWSASAVVRMDALTELDDLGASGAVRQPAGFCPPWPASTRDGAIGAEPPALCVQVIAGIRGRQLENGPFRKLGRYVHHQPSMPDLGLQCVHFLVSNHGRTSRPTCLVLWDQRLLFPPFSPPSWFEMGRDGTDRQGDLVEATSPHRKTLTPR